jgi:hypothetical protein
LNFILLDWIDEEIERLEDQKSDLEKDLKKSNLNDIQREKLEEELKQINQYLHNAEKLDKSCTR